MYLYFVVEFATYCHANDPNCVIHGDHVHMVVKGPLPKNNRGELAENVSETILYRKLKRLNRYNVRVKACLGNIVNFLIYLSKPPRVFEYATPHFEALRQEAEDVVDALETLEADEASDIDPKHCKESKTAKVMSTLIKIYRDSHCRDVAQFKKYCLDKGDDVWDFVWNQFISKGMRKFQEAIEICNELLRSESLDLTWEQSITICQNCLTASIIQFTLRRFLFTSGA